MGRYKDIVAVSGGMDSATVLAKVLKQSDARQVLAVGFEYGSKHNRYELSQAMNLCQWYKVDYKVLGLASIFSGFNSALLTDGAAIPEGHYEADSMKQTVVPGRNIIFASILAGIAMSEGATRIFLGIHAGDHVIYPDCRPSFYNAMREAIDAGTNSAVSLQAPFLLVDKKEILKQGIELRVPYMYTRTCYKDQKVACGLCGSCQERLSAFAALRIEDPISYDTRELIPKKE